MAVIRGQRQNVNPSNIIPNVSKNIILTDSNINDAMYLTLFNMYPKKVAEPDYQIKWNTDGFLPENDTTSAAVTSASSTISVQNPSYYISNDTWYNKRTGEMFKVISVDTSGSQITVLRGLGAKDGGTGTASAAMNSGDSLIRLGVSVNPEKSRAQTARTTTLTEVTNYTQAFRWEVEMGRRQVKASYHTGADKAYQFDKVFKEARKDISRALLFNEKSKFIDENNVPHTTTQGLFNVPESNVLNVGGVLYKNKFDAFLVEQGLRYGSSSKWMLTGTDMVKAVTEMVNDKLEIQHHAISKDGSVGFKVMKYVAPNGGHLNIVEDRNISNNRNGDSLILDMDQITYCHHSGNGINDDFHLVTKDATENDATNMQAYLYGDIGQKWGDEKTHAKILNVTGGAAGRAVS